MKSAPIMKHSKHQNATLNSTLNATLLATFLSAISMSSGVLAQASPQSGAASQTQTQLNNPQTGTDSRINADLRGYQMQQAAIKAANDTGNNPVKSYSLAKAQCWLDVSFHDHSRNDRSAFPQEAFDESVKITRYLASPTGRNPGLDTPLVNAADKLRDDLWAQAAMLKNHSGARCAEQLLACGEVELVHAGNEQRQQGWRHAKPYVQIAEDLFGEAKLAAERCAPVAVAAVAAMPAPAPVVAVRAAPAPAPVQAPAPAPAPIVRVVTIEKLSLAAQALFKFDKREQGDLLSLGKQQLDDLVGKINGVYASVESIALTGFTDRLGSVEYNNKLGLDRANTVKSYLQSKGMSALITTAGKGSQDPIVACVGNSPTPALTQCLQPNRRVEILITGVKK